MGRIKLVEKKFWVKKNSFGFKKFWFKKIFGSKKILGNFFFLGCWVRLPTKFQTPRIILSGKIEFLVGGVGMNSKNHVKPNRRLRLG